MTKKSYVDEGVQRYQSIDSHSIQVQQEKSSKGNQKSISVGNYSVQMTKKSYEDESVQIDQRVQYDEVNDEMQPSKT